MSIGTSIAKARALAGLSIDELSAITKLRATLLREMEADVFTHCGGRMYARGHVRNIAVALKVDDKEFLRIFDEEQGVEKRTMRDLLVENSVMRQPEEVRKVSWKALVIISLISLALIGLIQIIVSNVSGSTSSEVAIEAPTTATPTPTTSAAEQNIYSTGKGVEVIVATTRAKSWLFVSDSQGRTLFSGQLPQGVSKVFTSESQLDLKVGNAGGVDLQVNGKKIKAIGVDSQVVSVSYGVDS